MPQSDSATTIDPAEIAKFEAMAADWWDPDGKFRPLHQMNPCRLDYLLDQITVENGRSRHDPAPLSGLKIADIGCGGGLIAEPLARLGAEVSGFDAAEGNIGVARAHAATMGLEIDYRAEPAEAAAARGEVFDAITALEIVEHVADVPAFLRALADLLRPGGVAVLSTLNRTPESWATAIVGAERILRWLPVGTHDWSKFLTPQELEAALTEAGLPVVDVTGMRFDPLQRDWRRDPKALSVNYILTAVKPGA